MSEYEERILNFLTENKNKFTGKELMINLNIPEQATYKYLKKLTKQNLVEHKKPYYKITTK